MKREIVKKEMKELLKTQQRETGKEKCGRRFKNYGAQNETACHLSN